jgi:hypothetical protein
MAFGLARLEAVDRERWAWAASWLRDHGLPSVETGRNYVKSFGPGEAVPDLLRPLSRDGLVRLRQASLR